MYIIRIPIYPYIRSYLEVQYGTRICIHDHNYVSSLLRSMLNKFDKKDPTKVKPCQKLNLGATFDFDIGKNTLGTHLTNEDIRRFSNAIDLLIRQEMYRWCNHPNATDQVVDYNIRRFIDFYGFAEDDLPFENLKRWYYRERERFNKRSNNRLIEEYRLFLSYAPINNDLPLDKKIGRFNKHEQQFKTPPINQIQLIIPFLN